MRTNIAIVCSFCREVHAVEVNLAQYKAWQNGEPIQSAMPDLTPGEQQRLITGLCSRCQAEMFRGKNSKHFSKKVLTNIHLDAIIKLSKGKEIEQ